MSILSNRTLIEVLRDVLGKAEAAPGPDTPNIATLKTILRDRIAEIEAGKVRTKTRSDRDKMRRSRRQRGAN